MLYVSAGRTRKEGSAEGIRTSLTTRGGTWQSLLGTQATKEVRVARIPCPLCGASIDEVSAISHIELEEFVLEDIEMDNPDWVETDPICESCATYYGGAVRM